MNNFKLVEHMIIRDPELNIEPTNDCFLYHFKDAGISIKKLTQWLEGQFIDVYEFTGRFGSTKKCPWCQTYEDDWDEDSIEEHIENSHDKTIFNLNTLKLGQKTYSLLLKHNREGLYDAIGYYVKATCQDCITPGSKDRIGKCEIPEATRSRMRSLKTMGFACEKFNPSNYSFQAVAFIYGRKPIR